jgi:hypothetical protein
MNTRNFRIMSFVLAAMLGMSGLAAAAGPYSGGGGTSPQDFEKKQELVRKLHEEFYAATETTRQELFAKSRELDAQMYGPNPDERKIQSLAKEVSDLRGKLYSAHVTLQSRLIKEGFAGYGGYGRGMGRGYGPGAGGGASCCGEPGATGGYGRGRGYGPGMGGGASCCDEPGATGGYGRGRGYGPGMGRGYGW